jgi:BolA-like protein 3
MPKNVIQSILEVAFSPTFVDVKDVSGGCGAMFNITVESEKFKVSPSQEQSPFISARL